MNQRIKSQKSFKTDKYKRLFCWNCGVFLTEMHLGQNKTVKRICKECDATSEFTPLATERINDDHTVYKMHNGMFTSD